ncbi:ankyrin repeat protein [Purpureocillium lilacinum]|uniref:Ankyrin repeat protein n=1 Tax=Purpureocillium lilacinum TaxID=33203 RepID=A0A179H9A7_PURLI|nr:ankyrin repeat protein [Purpureocillium lilacinum]
MADPLSVSAAVAGFISLSLDVSTRLVAFYRAYSDQDGSINQVADDLGTLVTILQTLQQHLASRKFQHDEHALIRAVEGYVDNCELSMEDLQDRLRKFDKFKKTSKPGIWAKTISGARRLAFPFEQTTLHKLSADVERVKSNIASALDLLQQKHASDTRDDLKDIKSVLSLVRHTGLSHALTTWLKAPDPTSVYHEICRKKQADTGRWLVAKGTAFDSWLTAPNSLLWLNGFAGTGKSFLFCTAVQHAYRHRRSNPRIGLAFFFFSFSDASKQTTSGMLRSLVLQLSVQHQDGHTRLEALHQKYPIASPPDEALMDCLLQFVRSFNHVYLFLDALDESPCDDRSARDDVLQTISSMRRFNEPGLHIFTTSRDEPDIREALEPTEAQVVSLMNNELRDIENFISTQLKERRRLKRFAAQRELIQAELTHRAQGIFRWVECQLNALENCLTSPKQLKLALETLPSSLSETYERVLASIPKSRIEHARRVLTILCCAEQPVSVEELGLAVAVEIQDNAVFDPDNLLPGADILSLCPNFIEAAVVDHGDRRQRRWLRIAHFSVQEYLKSEAIGSWDHRARTFRIDKSRGNSELATIGLILLRENSKLGSQSRSWYDPIFRWETFPPYLIRNWMTHYKNVSSRSDRSLATSLVIRLLKDKLAFATALLLQNSHFADYEDAAVPWAAEHGLDDVLIALLDSPFAGRNVGTSRDRLLVRAEILDLALHAAALNGHLSTIDALLKRGADPNGIVTEVAPFEAAAICGFREIVTFSVDNEPVLGPKVACDTPLEVAAARGHISVVDFLLNRLATVKRTGQSLRVGVDSSFLGQSYQRLELLLDSGAEVHNDRQHRTTLEVAIDAGNVEVTRMLLGRGVRILPPGYTHMDFVTAVSTGDDETVRAILDSTSEETAHSIFGSVLTTFSLEGDADKVRAMLGLGQGISWNSTALHAACFMGHDEVAKILLEAGDMTMETLYRGFSPVQQACHG